MVFTPLISKKIKATHNEPQATMLGQDGALGKSPTLKKLDELIERKKINLEAYRTRTNNHLNSTTIKLLLEKFVKEIVLKKGLLLTNSNKVGLDIYLP